MEKNLNCARFPNYRSGTEPRERIVHDGFWWLGDCCLCYVYLVCDVEQRTFLASRSFQPSSKYLSMICAMCNIFNSRLGKLGHSGKLFIACRRQEIREGLLIVSVYRLKLHYNLWYFLFPASWYDHDGIVLCGLRRSLQTSWQLYLGFLSMS